MSPVGRAVPGRDEGEAELLPKARWYVDHGVAVVWIVLPTERAVIVVDHAAQTRLGVDDVIAPRDELPELTTPVVRLFRQL